MTPFSEHKARLVKIIGRDRPLFDVNNAIASMMRVRPAVAAVQSTVMAW